MPKGSATRSCATICRKVGGYGLDMMFLHLHRAGESGFRSSPGGRHGEGNSARRPGALQPVTTALFANSPFREWPVVGLSLLSRPDLERHVDNARRRHAALGFRGWHRASPSVMSITPSMCRMYFLYRDGKYYSTWRNKSFRKFLAREIPDVAPHHPDDERLGRSSLPPSSPKCG